MKKRVFAALMAGVMGTMMFGTTFVSAEAETPELKGEVYAFIAASLNNAMEEIQKNFNETYPDVEILYNADSSGTLQTQIEEGARCDIFFSAARKQMDALVDEGIADKDSVVNLLENKVVLIKPKGGETKVTGFENIPDAANLALAGVSQQFYSCFCMTVYRCVGNHNSFCLWCVRGPCIVKTNVMSKVFCKNRSVKRANDLDIQACGNFQ